MIVSSSQATILLNIADLTQVGEARRVASNLASSAGYGETQRGALGIIVTEAATNIIQHAGSGTIIVQQVAWEGGSSLDVLALDKGPGMPDIGRCLEDGFSTAGTAGHGLGAMKRMAAEFDLFSAPGRGTVVFANVLEDSRAPARFHGAELGVISVAKAGEDACGDSWSASIHQDWVAAMVVDGLGHGPLAAEAALEGRRIFAHEAHLDPAELLDKAHGAMRKTRGASMAIARVKMLESMLQYAGIGNVAGTVLINGKTHSLVSHSGTLGVELRKIHQFSHEWPAGGMLVMHSDGLSAHWRLDEYPGLQSRHSSVIAGVLFRDFARQRDDATVLAIRIS